MIMNLIFVFLIGVLESKFLVTGGLGYFARDFTIIKDDGQIDGRKLLSKTNDL